MIIKKFIDKIIKDCLNTIHNREINIIRLETTNTPPIIGCQNVIYISPELPIPILIFIITKLRSTSRAFLTPATASKLYNSEKHFKYYLWLSKSTLEKV